MPGVLIPGGAGTGLPRSFRSSRLGGETAERPDLLLRPASTRRASSGRWNPAISCSSRSISPGELRGIAFFKAKATVLGQGRPAKPTLMCAYRTPPKSAGGTGLNGGAHPRERAGRPSAPNWATKSGSDRFCAIGPRRQDRLGHDDRVACGGHGPHPDRPQTIGSTRSARWARFPRTRSTPASPPRLVIGNGKHDPGVLFAEPRNRPGRRRDPASGRTTGSCPTCISRTTVRSATTRCWRT